jgi:hypothetical protein
MVNKHMKSCSTSLNIKPTRMARIKKAGGMAQVVKYSMKLWVQTPVPREEGQRIRNNGKNAGKLESSHTTAGNVKQCSHVQKQWGSSSNNKTKLLFDSKFSLLCICPIEVNTYTKMWTQMHTATLVTKATRNNLNVCQPNKD